MEDNPDLDTIDDYLIQRRDRTFLLRVDDEKMKEAGLLPGDIVVLEKDREPGRNNLVVTRLRGEWAIRHYAKLPNDPDLEITGVVVGSFRRYL